MNYNVTENQGRFIVNFNQQTRMFDTIEHAYRYIQSQLEYEQRLLMAQQYADMQITLSKNELREYKKMKLKNERKQKLKNLNW